MYYNNATDSYDNDFLEQIFDTGIYCNIPYKIDRKKYNKILKKYNQDTKIIDADVVEFCYDYSIEKDDDNPWLYCFFAFPKNSPEESNDHYDCFQFDNNECKNKNIFEKYKKFVCELMKCVKDVDLTNTIILYNDKLNKMEKTFHEMNLINNIILSKINKQI